MKLVNRQTFLTLPANTLYTRYEHCVFGAIEIKGETCGENDWFFQSIASAVDIDSLIEYPGGDIGSHIHDILQRSEKTGESFGMDFHFGERDGCYDDGELFVIWENGDITKLIERLTECLQ